MENKIEYVFTCSIEQSEQIKWQMISMGFREHHHQEGLYEKLSKEKEEETEGSVMTGITVTVEESCERISIQIAFPTPDPKYISGYWNEFLQLIESFPAKDVVEVHDTRLKAWHIEKDRRKKCEEARSKGHYHVTFTSFADQRQPYFHYITDSPFNALKALQEQYFLSENNSEAVFFEITEYFFDESGVIREKKWESLTSLENFFGYYNGSYFKSYFEKAHGIQIENPGPQYHKI